MGNKFNICLAILQITAGILGTILFIKSIIHPGQVTITMTVLAFFFMVFGFILGIKGLYKVKKH